MDLIDIYKIFHSKASELTFSSAFIWKGTRPE
jgi:hypothetical protein